MAISIHAAREGGDQLGDYAAYKLILFQSTPPVKAATTKNSPLKDDVAISIHAAREGGDPAFADVQRERCISIHAAREGGDLIQ